MKFWQSSLSKHGAMSEKISFLLSFCKKWFVTKWGTSAKKKTAFSIKLIFVLLGWGGVSATIGFVLPQIWTEIPESNNTTIESGDSSQKRILPSMMPQKDLSEDLSSEKKNAYKILGLKRTKKGKPYSQIFTHFSQKKNNPGAASLEKIYTIDPPQGKIYKITFRQEGKFCGEYPGITQIINDRTFVLFEEGDSKPCKTTYEAFYELPPHEDKQGEKSKI